MGFTAGFLRADSLSPTENGYRLLTQVPWMRSLPFASVDDFSVSIDGHIADSADLGFHIDGETFTLEGLATLTDRFWAIQRRVAVDVRSSTRPDVGSTHRVGASAALMIPYIVTPVGPIIVPASVERSLVTQSPTAAP